MLSQFSWTNYLLAYLLLTLVYYTAILCIYFRSELVLLAGKLTGKNADANNREEDTDIEAEGSTLHFKRPENSEIYFFNKYDLRAAIERKDETLAQTFYLNKGHGVTLKEAYNFLNGRAVHKELTDKQDQKYKPWIQLDFNAKDKNAYFQRKQYHQNYGPERST